MPQLALNAFIGFLATFAAWVGCLALVDLAVDADHVISLT